VLGVVAGPVDGELAVLDVDGGDSYGLGAAVTGVSQLPGVVEAGWQLFT
jgi:hypothetical protein